MPSDALLEIWRIKNENFYFIIMIGTKAAHIRRLNHYIGAARLNFGINYSWTCFIGRILKFGSKIKRYNNLFVRLEK